MRLFVVLFLLAAASGTPAAAQETRRLDASLQALPSGGNPQGNSIHARMMARMAAFGLAAKASRAGLGFRRRLRGTAASVVLNVGLKGCSSEDWRASLAAGVPLHGSGQNGDGPPWPWEWSCIREASAGGRQT